MPPGYFASPPSCVCRGGEEFSWFTVHFDQCAYCLKPPDGAKGRIKKPTTIVANLPEIMKLSRRCSCTRPHTVLQGSVRTLDGVFNRTALAAAYPPVLCRALAGSYETAARRLHKNTSA